MQTTNTDPHIAFRNERFGRHQRQQETVAQIHDLFSKPEAEMASFMNNYFAATAGRFMKRFGGQALTANEFVSTPYW